MNLDHAFMVNNIEHNLDIATAEQIKTGIEWYMNGYHMISQISDFTGYSMNHVATATAHLSPRLFWSRNIKAAWAVCQGESKLPGIMNRSWDMAVAALPMKNPHITLNGPKVSRFRSNLLLLDMRVVTCDVWALRGAGVGDLNIGLKGAYEAVERAYQDAADNRGILPSHAQAIVWGVVKAQPGWKKKK